MIHNTKGIVLRQVKYGDTSLVVSIYTELLGVQSYMVQGVRTDKKGSNKANLYQPCSILDLVVYHHPNKNLQRIKEARIHYWYNSTYKSIVKSSLSIFCIEVFSKVITEPESHNDLFYFLEEVLMHIDLSEEEKISSSHLLFMLQLAQHLGFGIQEVYSVQACILDLVNGQYTTTQQVQSLEYITGKMAEIISELNVCSLETISSIKLNHHQRNELVGILLRYLQLHIPNMGTIKSVAVLQEVLFSPPKSQDTKRELE
jgi:DNA repair protein RecO (recombination protein O)